MKVNERQIKSGLAAIVRLEARAFLELAKNFCAITKQISKNAKPKTRVEIRSNVCENPPTSENK